MRVGGQFHAPAALPLGKRPGTHCTGGWVGPKAGLDGCWNALYVIILYYVVTLYYIILCYVTLYYIILCYVTLYYIILYYVMSHYIILCYVTSYYIMLCHIILYYVVTLYYVILCCHIILYYVMSHYIMLYYVMSHYIIYYIMKMDKLQKLRTSKSITLLTDFPSTELQNVRPDQLASNVTLCSTTSLAVLCRYECWPLVRR
jgi:hypothetical protein